MVVDSENSFISNIVKCKDVGIVDYEAEAKTFDDPSYVLILASKPDIKSHHECISSILSSLKLDSMSSYSFLCSKAAKSSSSKMFEVNTIVTLLKCSSAVQQQAVIATLNDSLDLASSS